MEDYTNNFSKIAGTFFEVSHGEQMAELSEVHIPDSTDQKSDSKESGVLEDAIHSGYNSKSEVILKKLLSVGIVIADACGWINLKDNTAEGIACMADKTIDVLKVAYKIAQHPDRTNEYIEHLVEGNAIRVVTFMENAIETSKEIVPNLISNWLILAGVGNEAIRPVVQQIYSTLADTTKECIIKGSDKLKEVTKTFLISATNVARKAYVFTKKFIHGTRNLIRQII